MARRKGRHGDGTVYRRKGSPYWWVKFYANGSPVYESTKSTDKAEAKRYLKRRLTAVEIGQFAGKTAERMTIRDLCQLVDEDYEVNAYRSRADLRRRIQHHLLPKLGALRAARFGTHDIKRYIAARRGEGAAPATINRELRIVKRGFAIAHQSDPPLVLRVPHIASLKEDNVRRGFVGYEEYLRLRAELPFHLQLFLVLAYNTGVRRSELLGDNRHERRREPLRWNQVDFDAKRIYFPRQKMGNRDPFPLSATWRSG